MITKLITILLVFILVTTIVTAVPCIQYTHNECDKLGWTHDQCDTWNKQVKKECFDNDPVIKKYNPYYKWFYYWWWHWYWTYYWNILSNPLNDTIMPMDFEMYPGEDRREEWHIYNKLRTKNVRINIYFIEENKTDGILYEPIGDPGLNTLIAGMSIDQESNDGNLRGHFVIERI